MTEQILKFKSGDRTSLVDYETYKLVGENDKILSIPTTKFDFSKYRDLNPVHIAQSMFQTMFANKGIGLTANQVGLNYSIFTVGMDDTNKSVFFNPEIIDAASEMTKEVEGCLSYPGLFLKVERPQWVKMKWQHVNGDWKEETFHGLTARVILHEMDHINGKLFTNSVGSVTLRMAKEKRAKELKEIKND
jgi:peptide deformylase